MTIICLSGRARCGKDTFANVLINKYGFNRVSFADPLRNICARVFYLDPDMFVADDKKDAPMRRIHVDFHDIDAIRTIVENEWGYTIDEEDRACMEEYHGRELDTPRDVLRFVGNMLRDYVDENIWINLAMAKVKECKGRIVITDARFENERVLFRKLGALLVLIKRGEHVAQEHEFNLGTEDEYDVVFDNSTTLHAYQSSVDTWYSTRKNELELYKVWKYE